MFFFLRALETLDFEVHCNNAPKAGLKEEEKHKLSIVHLHSFLMIIIQSMKQRSTKSDLKPLKLQQYR